MTIKIKHLTTSLTLVLVVLLFPSVVRTQTRSFTYKSRDYALDLPSAEWRAITVTGVAHDSTEFRYGDQGRTNAHPQRISGCRRLAVGLGPAPAEFGSRSLRGYVKGKAENFEGQ